MKHHITNWLILSVLSFILYWALWFMYDRPMFEADGYGLNVVFFDFAYCSLLTAFVMAVCHSVTHLMVRWSIKRWTFVMASSVSLIINLLLAHGLELLIDYVSECENNERLVTEGVYICGVIATMISMIVLSADHYRLYAEEQRLRRQNDVAIMKQQLDPHFVFNNLTTLDALIKSDPDAAHRYVLKFSRAYRYVLSHLQHEFIAVSEGVKFIRDYTDLLALGKPRHFALHIDDALVHDNRLLLPMSLQLLVENAIKHNRHSESEPIHIFIEADGDYIRVRNTLRPVADAKGATRIGLANLRQRCKYIIGKDCVVTHDVSWFEVKLPLA